MRIYIQISTTGTAARGPNVRQQQAITHHTHEEEKALHDLAKKECNAVPELLNFKKSNQDREGCVPGGYINHLVWDLVPGKQIQFAEFWSRDLEYRNMVRREFRTAWEEVRSCGWMPSFPYPGNIIFDEESQTVYISGFGICSPVVKNMPFEDEVYAAWNLVKRRSKLPNYRRIAGEPEFLW